MKSKKNFRKIVRMAIPLLILLGISLLEVNNYELREDAINPKRLNSSGYWEVDEYVINGNAGWETTNSTYEWCTGSGTWVDPYVIENVTFRCLDGSGNSLRIYDSDVYFIIRNCTFTLSGSIGYDAGIHLDHVGNGTLINNNCSFNNFHGIILYEYCFNNTISGNYLTQNSATAIHLRYSDNNNILDNKIVDNFDNGVHLYNCNNNTIDDNEIINNSLGIRIHVSEDNNVTNNEFFGNSYGISLRFGHNTKIFSNNISGNNNGIYNDNTRHLDISENTIENSVNDGIRIHDVSADNNTIYANNISANGRYGIFIRDSGCQDNMVYLNNFNDNNINAYDNGTDNEWDNGAIGNYWDNYTGYDDDFDGIGDTPYLISGTGDGQDNYPIWNFQSPIHIDDSPASPIDWAWAETQPWCSGSGTFSDPYIIDGLNITARGVGSSIMIGNSSKYFIVQNCKLIESGSGEYDAGVFLDHVGNGKLINNNCSFNNNYGILIIDSDNNTVSGNTASNNQEIGILIIDSDNNTVSGNTANNNQYSGISLYRSDSTTVSGNTANDNTYYGIFIIDSENATVSGNTANNNQEAGIFLYSSYSTTVSGNTANDNTYLGIYIDDSDSTTVSGNTANDNTYFGIYIDDSENATVSGNTANNNQYSGIYLYKSDNATVSGNTANNNQDDGIYIDNSDITTVSGNTANNNQYSGIYVCGSANTTVSGNTANNNTSQGIFLFYTDNNTVSGNTASNNQDDGISLYKSDSTTISGNTVDNNMNYGINITVSNYNLIYNNYFTNNGIHALDNGNSNNWNSSIIGNYWDNYAGYDDDFDGIGDSPHDFGTGIDYLPIWNFQSPIHIDDAGVQDWDWVKTQAWFGGGSGTDVDPYILKGLNINAKGTEYGIFIENSNQFFNLTECLFINSGSATHNAGIKLSHTNNSQISNCTSANNKYAGIELYYDCNNNTILNNILANNSDRSLYLREHSDFNIVRGNQIYNTSGPGIRFLHSEFNIILENEIFDCNRGIYVHASEKNTLKKNNIHDNTYGIMLQYGHYSNITENTISNNSYGIYYSASTSYCNFSRNLIEENTLDGIWIRESSLNNTILNNEVHNNQRYGIYFDNPNSHDNKFYLNEFIGNNIHSYDNGTNNYWDNGSIGNYWDDYTGVDANDDGIGDSPYIISGTAGSRDNFPIWADGDDLPPVITIISPLPDSVFDLVAPNYNITIVELNLDTIWYTLDGGITNYTITGLTGTFNQLAWEALSEGSVTIRFYANDTAGNIGFIDVEVIIEIPEDIPDDLDIISFGNYYILFTFITITILSFIILEKRKKK